MRRTILITMIALIAFIQANVSFAADIPVDKASPNKVNIPPSVLNIAKENTYPNPTQDLPMLQPSKFAKQLIDSSDIKIENPELIHMLNESAVAKAPLAFGYRATIYLGHWALNYESSETAPNWEYQKINTNYYDNRGGEVPYKIRYVQESQKAVSGGLTAKIPKTEDVQKMMLLKATEKTNLPLAFETIIGAGTNKDQVYNVASNRIGYLSSFASAVNEKGKVTYGEVYLNLKGNKRTITIKNITSQGIGAWIPVQDHVSFSFTVSQQPR
ncbi:YfkD family protein [Peribacillus frigoritolerans]|uniref:YfkD famly protein n=1 Tax=Peribacillus frigoritolerans TaxID=450367 RepID=UPI003B8ACEA4